MVYNISARRSGPKFQNIRKQESLVLRQFMVERFVDTLLKEIGNLRASSSGIWSNLVFNVDEMKWKLPSAQLLTFGKYIL